MGKKKEDENESAARCPLRYLSETFGGKWKLPILWHLAEAGNGGVRYNELRRQVRGVTNMMLTKCLRELEAAGLVLRRDYAEIPPRVEYALSETGRSLMPILKKLYRWEARRMRRESRERGRPPCGKGGPVFARRGRRRQSCLPPVAFM